MLGYTPTNPPINAAVVADDDNQDGDPITDRSIRLSWVETSQGFPGTELLAELGTLNFQNLDSNECCPHHRFTPEYHSLRSTSWPWICEQPH